MNAVCWNQDWLFWEEGDSFALVWTVPEDARTLTLPHDAMVERTPRPDSPNGGDTGWRDGGSYVYVKSLFAPEEYRHQTVALRFDGVYSNALVYVNGQLAGQRPYGYTPFEVPLNDFLTYGEKNEVRVLVKNAAMPNSRWYSGSGMLRDVWLLTADTAWLPTDGVSVVTQWAEEDHASLAVGVEAKNRSHTVRALRLELAITDPAGETAARGDFSFTLFGGGEETITQTILVPRPKLWSAETPDLYTITIRLLEGEKVLDQAEKTFGVRTLQLDPGHGLRVNGKTVKLRGACIHHDNGPLGAVSVLEAELRRIRILKEAGFNALRMAHNPASPALLHACDALGMYVMEEAFDMWTRPKKDNDYALDFSRWWKDDLAAMVRRDRTHPSVVLYSLGNEIPETGLPHGAALGREMARLVKELDPSRFTLTCVNGVFASGDRVGEIMEDVLAHATDGDKGGNVNDFMTAMDANMDAIVTHPIVSRRLEEAVTGLDLIGYNYMTARFEPDSETYPHRVMVGSETYPPEIARNWAVVEQLPALIGDFTWTGWDYIGEAGVGVPAYSFGEGGFGAQFPCQLAYCADIDLTGYRRPMSYFREIVFGLRKTPFIAVQHPGHYGQTLIKTPWVRSDAHAFWTWSGCEEKPVVVEVYAPGHRVELFQDGTSLGSAPAGESAGFLAQFETVYRPGKLEAVAYDETGKELGRHTLTTAGAPAMLKAEVEPLDAGADQSLVYVTLTLADEQGSTVPDRDGEVSVTVTGGELAGLCSGDPKPAHNYTEAVTDTFYGRALAVVRRAGKGPVTLTAAHSGGLTATLTLPAPGGA